MFDVVFSDASVSNYRDFIRGDSVKAKRFNLLLREKGILKPESKFYVSLALDKKDLSQTAEAINYASSNLLRV